MISDLVDFGKWLVENNEDGIGYMVKEDDYLLKITYNNEIDDFVIDGIFENDNEIVLGFYEKSIFNDILPTPRGSSDQNITIANNTNLMGFSPFLLNLDSDFLGRKIKPENYDNESDYYKVGSERFLKKKAGGKFKLEKTLDKFTRSLDDNKNNKQFNNDIITKLFDNPNELFLKNIPSQYEDIFIQEFFNNLSKEEYIKIINKFYKFLDMNKNDILDRVIKFKLEENVSSRFFIVGVFGDYRDLINDLCFLYCKLIKTRNKHIENYDGGICSIPNCNNHSITYPSIQFYAADKKFYFNYSNNIENSSLRLCDLCNRYMLFAFEKLKANFKGNILVIPKTYDGDYSEFLEIIQEDNDFEVINELLEENSKKFTYDFLIYTPSNALLKIEKYIDNYQAFLTKFDDINLYNYGNLNYLYNEVLVNDESSLDEDRIIIKISNLFDFQIIFKELFYEVDDGRLKYPKMNYFYQIYNKELTGENGIFNGFSSKTVNIFSKYKDNIFSFIYEANFDALNKNMINTIVLNSLTIFQKNSIKKSIRFEIVKRLNYWFMFKKEFLGDTMLLNENVLKLRQIFGHPNITTGENNNEKIEVVFDDVEKKQVLDLIKEDNAIKYYLIGQLIAYIDDFKYSSGKKREVFTNFITNAHRNNIKKLFATEILQKNVFYINQMNKKGKFLFTMLESDYGSLFNEEDLSYEDYILLLFTGYYTTKFLKKNYVYNGDE
ncbi:hypothetical protein mru_0793 [Methanobrevibacter ruminantium M1]|uniref:Uncharacterized protein n=1 Tax=Methanobrevibacter ruminantium (strain ATCC 35063 / DSM 1093 / JCM 13430 / OCM 146 / M1) TaxID=634498 RepID=D3E283_METRM|nr:hypothetical protein [Methanobrevibacter ruminantium]ADC46644.1 hypothetical protein mru_0793 [Methanobrevibacter ruminantium M1]